MQLKVIDRKIEFNIIPLSFINRNISSVFFKKNNKTLRQTFNHQRYKGLEMLFRDKYQDKLDLKLGDFLKELKDSNKNDYKKFLNKYGDNQFCEFAIKNHLNDKGIYCYVMDNEIKYIGRCTDNFKKRINQGYGKIHPKNCFIDGQATNCHLNSMINSSSTVYFGVYLMTDKSTEEIKELEKLILRHYAFEWNIQTA